MCHDDINVELLKIWIAGKGEIFHGDAHGRSLVFLLFLYMVQLEVASLVVCIVEAIGHPFTNQFPVALSQTVELFLESRVIGANVPHIRAQPLLSTSDFP